MKHRCNIKKVFGKSFHKNMSASDLQRLWDDVPEEIRSKNKDIGSMISTAVIAENSAKSAIPAYESARRTLNTQEQAVSAAAASSAGNPTYAIAKSAESAAKSKIDNLVNSFTSISDNLYKALETRFNEMGVCSETTDKELQNQDVL